MSKRTVLNFTECNRKTFTVTSSINTKICVCCLSRDVSFVSLKNCEHASFFSNIPSLAMDLKSRRVCKECHCMLKKFTLFKQQVEENVKLLNDQATKLNPNKLVHNLQCTQTEVLSTAPIEWEGDPPETHHQDADEAQHEVEIDIHAVKNEPGEHVADVLNETDALMSEDNADSDDEMGSDAVEIYDDDTETSKKSLDIEFLNVVQNLQSANLRSSSKTMKRDTRYALRAIRLNNKLNHLTRLTKTASSPDNDDVNKKIAHLTETQQVMQQIILTLSENQQNILFKLENNPSLPKLPIFTNEIVFKPISSEAELRKFERQLHDKAIEARLMKTFSPICGVGKGRGGNNAYMLLDFLFNREFLTKCSWGGGSRQDAQKICFKSFRRTINFFFKLVYYSDKTYTLNECEIFLKNILRNSIKRALSKQVRTSTSRKRKKRQTRGDERPSSDVGHDDEDANAVEAD